MRIQITSFRDSEADIRSLRDCVFGVEQGVPRELDWDGQDAHCTHVLAKDNDGIPIGTGRMRADGKIGRLAVLRHCRKQGVGGKMLETLVGAAHQRQLEQVYLHAQCHAIAFYEEHGFRIDGEEFQEAGILHVSMIRDL